MTSVAAVADSALGRGESTAGAAGGDESVLSGVDVGCNDGVSGVANWGTAARGIDSGEETGANEEALVYSGSEGWGSISCVTDGSTENSERRGEDKACSAGEVEGASGTTVAAIASAEL
ncbi:MAG: hypothetical protein AAFN08_08240, partial [Cyanobacteria bacterium J06559_3]